MAAAASRLQSACGSRTTACTFQHNSDDDYHLMDTSWACFVASFVRAAGTAPEEIIAESDAKDKKHLDSTNVIFILFVQDLQASMKQPGQWYEVMRKTLS